MTVAELIERLKKVNGSAEVELIVWDMDDECSPGLHCDSPTLYCDNEVACFRGAGVQEEMDEEDEEAAEAEDVEYEDDQ